MAAPGEERGAPRDPDAQTLHELRASVRRMQWELEELRREVRSAHEAPAGAPTGSRTKGAAAWAALARLYSVARMAQRGAGMKLPPQLLDALNRLRPLALALLARAAAGAAVARRATAEYWGQLLLTSSPFPARRAILALLRRRARWPRGLLATALLGVGGVALASAGRRRLAPDPVLQSADWVAISASVSGTGSCAELGGSGELVDAGDDSSSSSSSWELSSSSSSDLDASLHLVLVEGEDGGGEPGAGPGAGSGAGAGAGTGGAGV